MRDIHSLVGEQPQAGKTQQDMKLNSPPPSRKNLNKLILEMRKISKFPWDCFHPPPTQTILEISEQEYQPRRSQQNHKVRPRPKYVI